jgi:hypothetical protein
MTPDRLARMDQERAAYALYSEAFKKIRDDDRFANKSIYAYVGGNGKKLNQEIIGTNVIRTMINCGYFVAPERYLHEMSTEKGSREALRAFLDGLADWEAKEPGVKKQMTVAPPAPRVPKIVPNSSPARSPSRIVTAPCSIPWTPFLATFIKRECLGTTPDQAEKGDARKQFMGAMFAVFLIAC